MNLSPRATAIRLILWCGIFAWAVWHIRQPGPSPVVDVGPPSDVHALNRPAGVPAAPVAESLRPAGMIDPEALQRAVDVARAAVKTCGVSGTLLVTVGAVGLEHAEVRGVVDGAGVACAEDAVWALSWPQGMGEMEAESAI